MGSKARLSKYLSPIINNLIKDFNIKTYIEPFVGGANMIQHINCQRKIGSDNNRYLIALWNALKNGWIPPKEISREKYNDIKQNKEMYDDELVAVVGFCSTYNAKWFGGYAGIVDTKIGTKRNYYDESIRNILKQIGKLNDVEFLNFNYLLYSDLQNNLIYCDPPYQGTTKYGTSKYFDYEVFWDWVRKLSQDNIVLVSEYDAPDDFIYIYEKTLTTSLDNNSRKKDTEKLFLHNDSKALNHILGKGE